jgi:hypothetical protein
MSFILNSSRDFKLPNKWTYPTTLKFSSTITLSCRPIISFSVERIKKVKGTDHKCTLALTDSHNLIMARDNERVVLLLMMDGRSTDS